MAKLCSGTSLIDASGKPEKAKAERILVLDELKIEKTKTKEIAAIFKKLPLKESSVLLVLSQRNDNIFRAARNIPKTRIMEVKDLNALDLLSSKYLILTKDSVKAIKEIFVK